MTSEAEVTVTSTEGNDRLVVNQNKLADDPHFRGGKLGYTDEAGQTSLGVFNVPLGGETRPVVVIVLGSKDWKQDTRTLLRWLVDTAKE
jgi:D-alanyl-D-alanine carboxypeptidase